MKLRLHLVYLLFWVLAVGPSFQHFNPVAVAHTLVWEGNQQTVWWKDSLHCRTVTLEARIVQQRPHPAGVTGAAWGPGTTPPVCSHSTSCYEPTKKEGMSEDCGSPAAENHWPGPVDSSSLWRCQGVFIAVLPTFGSRGSQKLPCSPVGS